MKKEIQEQEILVLGNSRLLKDFKVLPISSPKSFLVKNILKKTPSLLVGFYAGIPYLRAGFSLANNILPLEILFSYGTVAGIGSLASWVLIHLTDDIEKDFFHKSSTSKKLKSILMLGASISGGILTAAPSAYIGFKYNNQSLYWTFSTLITDGLLFSYSVKKLIKNNYLKELILRRRAKKNKLLLTIKLQICNSLQKSKEHLINLATEQREIIEKELLSFLPYQPKYVIEKLILLANTDDVIKKSENNWQQYFIVLICILLVVAWEIVNYILAQRSFQLLIHDNVSSIMLAFFPVLLSSILQFDLTCHTFMDLRQRTSNFIHKTSLKTFNQQFYPKTNFVLIFLGILTAILSFPPRTKITIDTITGLIGIILSIFVSITTISYKTTAILQLKEDAMHFCARNFSRKNQNIAYLNEVISQLIERIQQASIDEVEDLIHDFKFENLKEDSFLASLLKDYFKWKHEEPTFEENVGSNYFSKIKSVFFKSSSSEPPFLSLPTTPTAENSS